MDATRFLQEVGTSVQERFVRDRSILSFEEYLQVFFDAPRRQARGVAQYLLDVFEHYGRTVEAAPTGELARWRLFDAPWGARRGAVAGQEEVAAHLVRILRNFARQGRVDRMILLHGPNGSAKSSLVAALMAAMGDYSRTREGAVYRLHWVFPSEKLGRGAIGFGGGPGGTLPRSFAHLEGEDLEARLVCEMKDHPLLLLPKEERRRLLEGACRAGGAESAGDEDFVIPEYLLEGDLCHKCRSVLGALMASYGGDFGQVMAHVQVERFHYSPRYLTGAVTVEPQMSVDADVRMVTLDQRLANLPAPIQSVSLMEAYGPLVNGNRGVVELSDLLKRPLEAFKYLLGTSETAEVRMPIMVLQLDTLLIASSNEVHLEAFKEHPDFVSFKGRMELVRVPYLRRLSAERRIYEAQVTEAAVGKHIAPHAVEVAARWAVLTRLKKPMSDRYPEEVSALVASLGPSDKLALYDDGTAPEALTRGQAAALRAQVPDLYHEADAYPSYEGRVGASPRELKTVLMNAAQAPRYACLTAGAVVEELRALVRDKSVYPFLQLDVVDGYHDNARFVEAVRARWLDTVDEEVRDALGLVAEAQYQEWFERYVRHVTAWVKGETLRNRITGGDEPPDAELMREVEAVVMGASEDRDAFRHGLITTIGAHRLEHPDEDTLDYPLIFPDLFRRLRDRYHAERRRQVGRAYEAFLKYLDPVERGGLSERDRVQVETLLGNLVARHGYCEHCARDAVLDLIQDRQRA